MVRKRISRNLIQSNAPFLSNSTSTKLSSKIKQSTKHFQNIQKTFSIPPYGESLNMGRYGVSPYGGDKYA